MSSVNMNPSLLRPEVASRQAEDKQIEKQAVDAVSAKVAVGSSPITASSASLIASVQKEDAVQASADVIKLSAESLAKATKAATPVANNANVAANLITGVNKAMQGDKFAAASALGTAVEKASPALANSAVGAVANAVILGTSRGQQASQVQAMKESAGRVMAEGATAKQRLKATFDLTTAVQGLANVYRSIGNAVWKLGTFGLARAAKIASLAPAVTRAQGGMVKMAASPLGKAAGFLNKWVPFLNIAGVALSAKNAVTVHQDAQASRTSKLLSIASVGAAVASLVAGFTLKGLPFVGVLAGSIATDVALANARQSDAQGKDTDARARHWVTHPGEAVSDLATWGGKAIPELFRSVKTKLTAGWNRVRGLV